MEDQHERVPVDGRVLVEEKVPVEQLVPVKRVPVEERFHLEERVPVEGRIPVEENFDPSVMGRINEDGYESMSGSGNLDGGLEDEQETLVLERPAKKLKYHRHTQEQINELETCFKEWPHPDEKQRLDLSRKLNLEPRQVKFWFQNRRTQMKNQLERHENVMLRQENDKLRVENVAIKDAVRNPICNHCGGVAMLGNITIEENQLRVENAQLRDELSRICGLAEKFLGRPVTPLASPIALPRPSSNLELEVAGNGFGGLSSGGTPLPMGPLTRPGMMGVEKPFNSSVFVELAVTAMDELLRLAQADSPIWMTSLDGGKETLNPVEYMRTFSPCIGLKPSGFVTEASRETGIVMINSLALVETLMDGSRWAQMFPCVIAKASTTDVLSSGIGRTRHGALQLMHAEFQVLSPLVPVRQVKFLRFCKQHGEGLWAVVDVSIDTALDGASINSFVNCRRLPSGCVMQDLSNGYTRVTWIEHSEYDESAVHYLYRSLLSSGLGFGALRWLATLQRQCESIAILLSSTVPCEDHPVLTQAGRRSLLQLTNRMRDNFCAGVCASTVRMWNKLHVASLGEDVKVMTRKSMNIPGEPPGVILSAATSVWMPIMHQQLFSFLRDERQRSKWDILSNGGPMQEMIHIPKGQTSSNCVSLLHPNARNQNDNTMLILQETWADASGSLIVYAPLDVASMRAVMTGGDSSFVALLPSGFAIVPDGSSGYGDDWSGKLARGSSNKGSGSLLTVAFQILVNSLPMAKLNVESVETVNSLLSCTINKIKSAVSSA